jgi:hypothetical protein
VLGFESVAGMKAWLDAHAGRAAIAIAFGDTHEVEQPDGTVLRGQVITDGPLPPNLAYEIWYNSTAAQYGWYGRAGVDALGAWARGNAGRGEGGELAESSYILAPQFQVEQAVLAHRAAQAGKDPSASSLTLGLKAYPRVMDAEGDTLGVQFGGLFLCCALCLSFVAMTARVVLEKERHVAGAMRLAGLTQSAHCLSYWGQAALLAFTTSGLVLGVGTAFRLPLVVGSDPGVMFATFLTFMLAMAAASFLLASLTHSVLVASVLSIAVVLVGAALAVMASSPATNALAYIWWEADVLPWVPDLVGICVPALHLLKVLSDATVATSPTSRLNATTGKLERGEAGAFGWEEMHSMVQNRTTSFITYDSINDPISEQFFVTPPPIDAFRFLFVTIAMYSLLAWYTAQVLTGEGSAPLPLYFPLLPGYWCGGVVRRGGGLAALRSHHPRHWRRWRR